VIFPPVFVPPGSNYPFIWFPLRSCLILFFPSSKLKRLSRLQYESRSTLMLAIFAIPSGILTPLFWLITDNSDVVFSTSWLLTEQILHTLLHFQFSCPHTSFFPSVVVFGVFFLFICFVCVVVSHNPFPCNLVFSVFCDSLFEPHLINSWPPPPVTFPATFIPSLHSFFPPSDSEKTWLF